MVSVFPSSNADYLTHLDIQNFDKHWVAFMRDRYGCPNFEDAIDWKNCNPKLGSVNFSEYEKARKIAKRIFDLEDKEKHK